MAEGVKIGARLRRDLDIVQRATARKAQEKESWVGIAPMLIGNLEPDRQFKKIKATGWTGERSGGAQSAPGGRRPAAGEHVKAKAVGQPHFDQRAAISAKAKHQHLKANMDLKLKQHRTGRLLLSKQFTAGGTELNAASVRFQTLRPSRDSESANVF